MNNLIDDGAVSSPMPEDAPAQLRVSETRYRRLFEAARDGILILDAVTRKITDVNPFMVELLGYAHDDFLGKELWEIGLLKDAETSAAAFTELQETGYIRYDDLPLQSRSGQAHDVEFVSNVYEENGRQVVQCNIRDITERKRAENASALLAAIVESSDDGIIGKTLDGIITTWNAGAQAMYGYTAQEAIGRPVSFLAPSDLPDEMPCLLEKIRRGEPVRHYETVRVRKDGSRFDVSLTISPVKDAAGNIIGASAIKRDISERKEADTALRSSEERYRSLALATAQMVWTTDAQGNVIEDLPAWRAFTGQSVEETRGQGWLQAVHPDDREHTANAMLVARNALSVYEVHCRICAADGTYRFFTNRGVPVLDDQGGIREWVGSYTDVTDRGLAEKALRKAHNELEMRVAERTSELAQSNRDLQVQIKEREDAVAETRVRARQQEAVAELGRQALTEIHIDSLLKVATQLMTATLDVELSTVAELLPAGTLWIRATTGWQGYPPREAVPGKDKSQSGFTLLTNAPVIVADLQTEKRFEASEVMLAQRLLSGITVVIGGKEKPFGTLGAHSTRRRVFNQEDVHFLQSISNVLAATLEQRRSNENLRIENVERQMAMGALEEVTEGFRAAKEEAEQARESADAANLAKSEFLSRMSHELRTPLNAILGFSQLLFKQDFTPAQQEMVQHILQAGRHLLDLINEVLEIARIESGHILLSLEPVQVRETVEEVFSLLTPMASGLRVELRGGDDPQLEAHVLADRQRLKQALLNLCANAIKYNRLGGSIRVTCEAVRDIGAPQGETTASLLRIRVTDTGMGIAAADLKQLFVPFMRVGAEKTTIEGTGLGLALSRSLMQAMGGSIGVESTVGVGSTFWLQLPLASSPVPAAQHLPEAGADPSEPAAAESPKRYKLLYIEDNLSNLQLIEAIIRDEPHYELISAMQGQIGLDLARLHHPDLILLDLHLPDLPGDQVLERLKAQPATAGIPVVMLSAVAMDSEIKRLLAGGAVAYLTKPLNIALFLDTLADILHPHQGSS